MATSVTAAELAVQTPVVIGYLRQHVQLEINGQGADLGDAQPVVFPPGVGDAIPEINYHDATSLVHFAFRQSLAKAPADFWVRFDLFVDLGEQHTVLGAIECDGEDYELLFRFYEPDFLYDTGYAPTEPTEPKRSRQPGRTNGADSANSANSAGRWSGGPERL